VGAVRWVPLRYKRRETLGFFGHVGAGGVVGTWGVVGNCQGSHTGSPDGYAGGRRRAPVGAGGRWEPVAPLSHALPNGGPVWQPWHGPIFQL